MCLALLVDCGYMGLLYIATGAWLLVMNFMKQLEISRFGFPPRGSMKYLLSDRLIMKLLVLLTV